jgi:hypothetical protein
LEALSPGRAQNENGGNEPVGVVKPNIKFERDSKQMLAAAQLGVNDYVC